MPERRQHRVSGAQDGRSERPATGRGHPRAAHRHEPAALRPVGLNTSPSVEDARGLTAGRLSGQTGALLSPVARGCLRRRSSRRPPRSASRGACRRGRSSGGRGPGTSLMEGRPAVDTTSCLAMLRRRWGSKRRGIFPCPADGGRSVEGMIGSEMSSPSGESTWQSHDAVGGTAVMVTVVGGQEMDGEGC